MRTFFATLLRTALRLLDAIITVVYYVVATRTWGWPAWKAGPLAAAFLALDLAFFSSTAVKLPE